MIVWVYDKWGTQIGNLKDFMGFVHDDELGALDFVEFTLVGEQVSKDDYLVWRDEFGVWHEHIVKSVTVNHSDGMVLQNVYALNSICELTKSYIDERDAYNTTNVVAFTRALDGTRWQNGSVSSLGNNSVKFYHTSVYDGIVNILNKWGGEISTSITVSSDGVSSRAINHKKTIGEDNGLLFTYGFDMSNIERKVELDDVYTRLYVFGKGEPSFGDDGDVTGYGRRINFAEINGGKEYVEDNTAMQKWGVMGKNNVRKHSEGTAIFEECEDKHELLSLGKAKLEEVKQPRITYTTNVSILADAGMQFKNARRGDVCYIRDKVLDERLNGRILHVRRYLNSTNPTEITIGNLKRTVADVFKEQQKKIDKLQNESVNWEGATNYNREWLDQMMNHLNEVMNDSGGYAYWEEGEGITVYDRPKDQNPTMAIQLKGAGFRIANSKNSDGSWNWRTFGTGDGFTADVINVGTLKCGENRIDLDSGTVTLRNGIIQDLKSLNYINLGTGECRLAAAATVGGKTVPEIAQETVDAEVNNFVSKVYDPKIAELQKQIDGQIETWYYDYEPKLTNKPASDWNTEAKKEAHEGDLFYWKSKGYAYRFFKDGSTWKWDMVQDTDITRALAGAAAAQDTADQKRRVFVSQPKPPYDVGDLWVQGTNGDIMRCQVARQSGSYASTDWIKASKYTDDSALKTFMTGEYAEDLKDIESQIDGKAETWYQTDDPSKNWTTTTLKNEHKGDLWYNSSTNECKRWNGTSWVNMAINPPQSVFDAIDGKAQIFIAQPKPPYQKGDLWFNSTTSDIMTCISDRASGTFSSGDWEKRNKYTDNSALDSFINGEFADLEEQVDGKVETWAQTTDPSENWKTDAAKSEHKGDLWFNTETGIAKRWSGTAWVEMTTNPPQDVFDEIDGKAQIFTGTTSPKPPYSVGDLWFKDASSDIMTCISAKSSGSYNSSDWAKRNKYIDQSAADSAAASAVNAQTQESIFNKLTNNKKNQGIYIQDGNLYLNGSMMAIGKITSKEGSYWDLANGDFENISLISETLTSNTTAQSIYSQNVLVVDMKGSAPFGVYTGERTRILNKSSGESSYTSIANKSKIGGVYVDGSEVGLLANRVGRSSTNYITTGSTTDGFMGSTYHNSRDGDYFEIGGVGTVSSSYVYQDGIRFKTKGVSFLEARENKSVYLYIPDGNISYPTGFLMTYDTCIIRINSQYYIQMNGGNIVCRTGNSGFGWYNGKFNDSLTWSSTASLTFDDEGRPVLPEFTVKNELSNDERLNLVADVLDMIVDESIDESQPAVISLNSKNKTKIEKMKEMIGKIRGN